MQDKKEKDYGAKWRIPFGLFMFLLVWAIGVGLINLPGAGKILGLIITLILYLFLFGVLGSWLMSLDILGAVNGFLKIFGTVCGYVGFFLRPFPIIVYGANKKWIVNLFAVVILAVTALLVVIQILTETVILYGIFNYFSLGITVIFTLFTLFAVKKCPNCKCVMSLIDFDSIDIKSTKYYKDKSENVGYVSDGYGNTADVYANVTYEYSGKDNTFAKIYTCGKCGGKKYGKKIKAITEI